MKQRTKVIFCNEEEILTQKRFTKLRNLLITGRMSSLDKEDKKRVKQAIENLEIPDFMTCDPDYIRYTGMELDYSDSKSVSFEEYNNNGTSYIYSQNTLSLVAQKMLTEFFLQKPTDHFELDDLGTGEAFYNQENSIAYHGSFSYGYNIWNYKG